MQGSQQQAVQQQQQQQLLRRFAAKVASSHRFLRFLAFKAQVSSKSFSSAAHDYS
jgi:hypothetical protein